MRSSITVALTILSFLSVVTAELPSSPTSNVPGLAFERFVSVFFENVDFNTAVIDPNFQRLVKQGLLLRNFFAVTHPSQPNYCASAGGDTFGMDNDNLHAIPSNVSTVADLLDTRGISWGEYQEGLPYAGFQGFNYSKSTTVNDYVRKHNPLVQFNSVADYPRRLGQIKNFTSLYDDIKNKRLPQWLFITPNMLHDGHDTNVTYAASWAYPKVVELLQDEYFNKNTLILLTFDESGNYTVPNRIWSLLVGGAVPKKLWGTSDETFYTTYSSIATVSANWKLPSLGRWDCGANIFELVAKKTGYVNYKVDYSNLHLNQTYPGPLSSNTYSKYSPIWPIPATQGDCSAGHGILEQVQKTYGHLKPTYNYTSSPFPYDNESGNNVGINFWKPGPGTQQGLQRNHPKE